MAVGVGSRFPWRGFQVTVTSFALGGEYLTACSYTDNAERKVAKRFRITIADIRVNRRERKDRIQLHKQLIKMDNEEEGVLRTFSRRAGLSRNGHAKTRSTSGICRSSCRTLPIRASPL